MLKLLTVCVLILGCGAYRPIKLHPDVQERLMRDSLQCLSETGANPSVLGQIKDRKFSSDEQIKSFILCTFKKTGVANKKGDIIVEKLLDLYPNHVNKSALQDVIEECEKGNDLILSPADKVYSFFKCYVDKSPVRVKVL